MLCYIRVQSSYNSEQIIKEHSSNHQASYDSHVSIIDDNELLTTVLGHSSYTTNSGTLIKYH